MSRTAMSSLVAEVVDVKCMERPWYDERMIN
jgi:hypothetical protein